MSTRLTLGFGLVSLLGVIIAGIGAWQMRDIANNLDEVANDRMIKVERFSRVKDNLNQIAIHARNVLVSSDQRQQEQEIARIRALRSENTEIITLLEKIVVLPRGKELLAVVTTTRGTYNGLLDQAIALDRQGKAQEAADLLLGPVVEKQAVIFKAVDESVSLQRDLANALAREAIGSSMRNTWTLGALALLIGLLGTAITTLVVRSLSRALGAEPAELGAAAERVSQGDLSPVAGAAEAPSGSVLAFLGTMQQGLAKVVAQVRTSSDSIATGSTQIASGNADLSQRTEEQASNLQQTAASMEEIASTVKSNAETSQQATALAQGAATAAQHGGELVGQVVTTMQQISDSSRRIADITATIDGIAFQTNILALNAAVEAARAGEQGRGFAVVAGEVRSLAQRAAGAAREIKALIGASVEKVTTGVEQADRAGSAMGEIVGQIQRVSQLITDMATATAEQSAGIGQVGDAVSQLDQVTQQNAALVEESAAAAESLRVQAVRLSEVVSTFKLGSSDAAGAALGGGATPTDERSRTAPARRLVSPPQPRLPSGSARAQPARAEAAAVDADWAAF